MAAEGPNLVPVVTLLGAAVVAVPIFKRLGLGAVLGYLAAGLLVGPSVLGLIHDPQTILHTAELGVVMFLFVVGLEMRPAHLWQLRRQIFGLGALQVGLAMVLLTPVGVALGLSWVQAWVAGTGFVLTSTAIVMQMLSERKQLNTSAGQKVVAILLLEDLLIVPLLAAVAFLSPLAEQADWLQRLSAIGLALGATAVLLAVGRWLPQPLFQLLSAARSREVMTAAALLVVLGAALWMELGGLSAAMGAFLAGVMLAESSFRHQLEADIEPFKGLLLGLFFLAVGMSMDLQVVVANWRIVLAGVLAYMLLKALAIYAVARLARSSAQEAIERMVLMAQGGEFAFVLYAAAVSFGLLDARTNSLCSAIITLSMVLTPLLLALHGRWQRYRLSHAINPREMDTEMEHSQVIIAGFGRFGQVVGRLLMSNGIVSTIMDNDAQHIENMRPFGFKVYYGDATRLDLLQAAGAAQARLLVVAVDQRDDARLIVERVRQAYPHLRLLVRAYDVTHYYELKKAGAHVIQREVYESSLMLGRSALETLGIGAYEAKEMADAFRRTNQTLVDNFARIREQMPPKDYARFVRESREELERQLREETQRGKPPPVWSMAPAHAPDSLGQERG